MTRLTMHIKFISHYRFILQRYKCVIVSLIAMALTGCVTVTPVITKQDADQIWQARSEYLYQQNHWTVHLALIGVTAEQKFKTRAIWEQKGDRYTIKLRDFIGRTVAIIDGSPEAVSAKTSKGEQFKGDNAEQLIKQLFDIQIPVAGMRYWLLGLPKPNVEIKQLALNDQGLAEQVNQQGWAMSYPYYLEYDPFKMPSQILLAYDDIDLTVKVSQWVFNTE